MPAPCAAGRQCWLVSVVFVELSPAGLGVLADPEDLRELVGVGLAGAISEVESLGGTVAVDLRVRQCRCSSACRRRTKTTPSAPGATALRIIAAVGFSPCEARAMPHPSAKRGRNIGTSDVALSVRVGVGDRPGGGGAGGRRGPAWAYGAVGEVARPAAALQSVARPGSVLVGPATRAATEGIFDWGAGADVLVTAGAKPLEGTYLVQSRACPLAQAGWRRLVVKAPLVGRDAELALLTEAARVTVSGRGGAVVIVGEPGLGKQRASSTSAASTSWAGSGRGRGGCRCGWRAVAPRTFSSTPYDAYQQLLGRFMARPLKEPMRRWSAQPSRRRSAVLGTT